LAFQIATYLSILIRNASDGATLHENVLRNQDFKFQDTVDKYRPPCENLTIQDNTRPEH